MSPFLIKTAVRAQSLEHRVRARLNTVREHGALGGDRGESPIQTVIIVLAGLAGALLIAGGLAALYAKYGGQMAGK
ncbi:hypothetical protein GCM10010329_83060 [Streptomyces spiroverticillatus]|uniref:Uncharacterized protein n=1 Tax=Streptomyces finlayi TaxID=67296 RepID=A0A918X8Z6_9ACTN|nr:hypothetical protein [Streptomyces finlayi]GHA48020.1 hypothetical protein GCM10010329_83060 [Streptomyces spiroverticillatus]GHD18877.1 hypothetical protein GCM10010334_82120 [Streptomyces finlayi]